MEILEDKIKQGIKRRFIRLLREKNDGGKKTCLKQQVFKTGLTSVWNWSFPPHTELKPYTGNSGT